MTSPNFVRIGVIAALSMALTSVVHAQVSGYGTTGPTDGSGRGTGSAGVQAGGGPDTEPWKGGRPLFNLGAERSVTTTTTTRSENVSTAKKESRSTRKHSKKTSKRSQTASSPSPSASPR